MFKLIFACAVTAIVAAYSVPAVAQTIYQGPGNYPTYGSQKPGPNGPRSTSGNQSWLAKFPHAISSRALNYYEIPETSSGLTLYAWLATPAGSRPAPTIILLPGCNGLFGTGRFGFIGAWPQYQFWSNWLASEGYATLILDSFTGRGINQICNGRQELDTAARAIDVYTAAAYLAQRVPTVDAQRLGVLGDSHGAGTTVQADNINNPETKPARATLAAAGGKINAFVALYVGCAGMQQKEFSAPLLLLIGGADDWTPPTVCEELINYPSVVAPTTINTFGAPVTIMVYPGATHAFDVQGPAKTTPAGYHLRYDPIATADAQRKILQFFRKYLGN